MRLKGVVGRIAAVIPQVHASVLRTHDEKVLRKLGVEQKRARLAAGNKRRVGVDEIRKSADVPIRDESVRRCRTPQGLSRCQPIRAHDADSTNIDAATKKYFLT